MLPTTKLQHATVDRRINKPSQTPFSSQQGGSCHKNQCVIRGMITLPVPSCSDGCPRKEDRKWLCFSFCEGSQKKKKKKSLSWGCLQNNLLLTTKAIRAAKSYQEKMVKTTKETIKKSVVSVFFLFFNFIMKGVVERENLFPPSQHLPCFNHTLSVYAYSCVTLLQLHVTANIIQSHTALLSSIKNSSLSSHQLLKIQTTPCCLQYLHNTKL